MQLERFAVPSQVRAEDFSKSETSPHLDDAT